MESILNYEISFYDIIHMIIASKTGAILVTRDRKLLESAKKFSIVAHRPEEL
jgi:predicted nucleic acid-binding protein